MHDVVVLTESQMKAAADQYLRDVQDQFASGHALEHAYRPALQRLFEAFEDIRAVNDPRQSQFGAPDFVLVRATNPDITCGHAEAKDVGVNLDRAEASDQLRRYGGYANLILTDYLEFRFFANGVKYQTVKLGRRVDGSLEINHSLSVSLMRSIQEFLTLPPEAIQSGKRLAEIMGAKARLIRDVVAAGLARDTSNSSDIGRIYKLMREQLVSELAVPDFADMYAQTLVYGLFVARYNDPSLATFSRAEARDLVPSSNPFLKQFFDHIAGANFDSSLAKIVDALCQVLQASNVAAIVHRFVNSANVTEHGTQDPVIHFFEDFLEAYSPEERRRRGAYYTPVPVVRYIVRSVDRALRERLGIEDGLASTDTVLHEYETGQVLRKGRRMPSDASTKTRLQVPRVQVLDPAVGTATFLNETILHIWRSFEGQRGMWPSYVRDNLLRRVHGFELMMAPYTIAHLKLGITLTELGATTGDSRLNVLLTNSLTQGATAEQDLFSFGLAEVITEEARLASDVKSQHPVMVVLGNPPYSGTSANNSQDANALVKKYKVEPGGETKLNERKHWLNDDYVKFIAFAEDMILRNGSGVVAFITNHSYLDSPTFRGMRWHLCRTFDFIDIVDLHGNANRKEFSPDGSSDQNVFDIKAGVSIIVAVKTGRVSDECVVRRADLWGSRASKFSALNADNLEWSDVSLGPTYEFSVAMSNDRSLYEGGVSLKDLFLVSSNAAASARDRLNFAFTAEVIAERMEYIRTHTESEIRTQFELGKDSRDWQVSSAKQDVIENYSEDKVSPFLYRPFDVRYTFYSGKSRGVYSSPQSKAMRSLNGDVLGMMFNRKVEQNRPWADVFVTVNRAQYHALSMKETNSIAPLYFVDAAGMRHSNLDPVVVARLVGRLSRSASPEDVFCYVYGRLQDPRYRRVFDAELRRDFPRVPVPVDDAEFEEFRTLGEELIEAHLMRVPVEATIAAFPVAGSDVVEKVDYSAGRVSIHATQYFDGVAEAVWDCTIGSYRPAVRWLEDRKGVRLSNADIGHYRKLVNGLARAAVLLGRFGAGE